MGTGLGIKSRFRTFALGVIGAAGMVMALAPSARADVIVFDNQNGDHIFNSPSGPPVATSFTLASDTYITTIDVYHFGDPLTTTTLSLMDGVTSVASALATVSDIDSAYRHLVATFNQTIFAGTYTIADSRYDWWSYNSASGNRGFATVYSGTPPAGAPVPGALALLSLGLIGIGAVRRKLN